MTNTEENVHTTTTTPAPEHKLTWTTAIETYRERRTARAALKATERELASYTTPNELDDLDAMIERCADDHDMVYGPLIERIRLRAA